MQGITLTLFGPLLNDLWAMKASGRNVGVFMVLSEMLQPAVVPQASLQR